MIGSGYVKIVVRMVARFGAGAVLRCHCLRLQKFVFGSSSDNVYVYCSGYVLGADWSDCD
jgi:hypothetical protein